MLRLLCCADVPAAGTDAATQAQVRGHVPSAAGILRHAGRVGVGFTQAGPGFTSIGLGAGIESSVSGSPLTPGQIHGDALFECLVLWSRQLAFHNGFRQCTKDAAQGVKV